MSLRTSPAIVASTALLLSWIPGSSLAAGGPGLGDWGDAPEGALAYPALGVAGAFPSCFGGPSGFIWHGVAGPGFDMHWGFVVDPELDGNAGFCPPPPYERDECWGPFDGDGGLSVPDTYSIDAGNNVVPCGQIPPRALGTVCQVLFLTPGGPFEANIANDMALPGYVNVLFDWNQDGAWNGVSFCGPTPTPEHAIQNVLVPPLYHGPLTGLSPGPIQIGPQSGFVWIRLSLTERPVPADWDGSGVFDAGETEDYLLRIDDQSLGEYGDAPEGVLAYPNGVNGAFPTCIAQGPAGYVVHGPLHVAYFGPDEDYEVDGNASSCPAPPYDLDECAPAGGDAGLLSPGALTLTPTGVVTACPGASASYWTGCLTARWGADVDIQTTNASGSDHFVNLLVDWDGDGQWTPAFQTCPNGAVVQDHVLVDFVVPAGFSGPLSMLAPPDFTVGAPPDGLAWARFTISESPLGPGWTGEGSFVDGETEDYLFRIAPPPVDAPDMGAGARSSKLLEIRAIQPNPLVAQTSIHFATGRRGRVVISVYDTRGRRVATVEDRVVEPGTHASTWTGRDEAGHDVAPGVYFVRARLEGEVETAKLVVIR